MVDISWEVADSLAAELAAVVERGNCRPNIIMAMARGGFVPARLLSSRLDVRRMASIGITYADAGRTELIIYSVPQPLGDEHRILLVEDVVETGRSLRDAHTYLTTNGAKVWTAAFYYQSRSVISPDFSLGIREDLPKFPWE